MTLPAWFQKPDHMVWYLVTVIFATKNFFIPKLDSGYLQAEFWLSQEGKGSAIFFVKKMPPKKQQKANGFMVFTLEWKNKYGRGISISEATEAAGNVWKSMDAEERAFYNEKAKSETITAGRNAPEKLTCTGTPLSLVEKEKQDQENKERLTKRDIESTVSKSVKRGQLERQTYFFIMANYFTKTLKGGVYVPAEIAVCKFSLKEGVHDLYQTFVNPGVIYGHQYEAQHHSETTHNLPLPPKALGETKMGSIYNDILNFIRDADTGNYPPVYTHRDSIHIVESVLEFLKTDTAANDIDLKVYPIQHLFYIMKEATCEAGELEKPRNFYITDAYFERDFFEFHVGIGCQFHEDNDKCKYCTQSYVTRWGFMFADYMCRDIAIPLTPGRHCPANTNLNAIITPAPSTYSDNESFISTGTTATYLTKPVAGSKVYYDDQKTTISDASKTYTLDFPALGGRSNGARKKVLDPAQLSSQRPNTTHTLTNSFDSGEMLDCAGSNPWTSRSRNVPREPANSHFDIDYTNDGLNSDADDYSSVASFGRGRLPLIDASFNSIGGSSYGRGRYLRP